MLLPPLPHPPPLCWSHCCLVRQCPQLLFTTGGFMDLFGALLVAPQERSSCTTPRGRWCTQRGAAAGTRHSVRPGRHQPCRALRSCTAWRALCWQRRAPTRQPGVPRSPAQSTQGGGWCIEKEAAWGQVGLPGSGSSRGRQY